MHQSSQYSWIRLKEASIDFCYFRHCYIGLKRMTENSGTLCSRELDTILKWHWSKYVIEKIRPEILIPQKFVKSMPIEFLKVFRKTASITY